MFADQTKIVKREEGRREREREREKRSLLYYT